MPLSMKKGTAGIEVGVDIGGTFTDIVCQRRGEPLRLLKVSTTKSDPSAAVMQAVDHMVEAWGIEPADITRFLHGTTIATNAVVQRKGAKIGLLATEGFRDILEMGRMMRQAMYRVILEPEAPVFLAPRRLRKEVTERIAADGTVLVPLDEEAVVRATRELVETGVEAIAVAYLFSFRNPAHELRTREIIARTFPDIVTSLSCEVDPAFREYERTVVTAFDAFMKPVVNHYLKHLEEGLAQKGVAAPVQVMQSRGGLAAAEVARQRPVRLFMSGPAAGVVGGALAGQAAGSDDLITVDIGGTTSDIALVHKGRPIIKPEGRIAGFPVRVPMVDVNSIGSGGGSIAWLDGAGTLRVGPHSAGSEPGPACYGRGGVDATVTDASLVLGYINPDYFAGGSLALDPERARKAINESIAKPLGLSLEAAALGIHRVVNTQMVEGIRLVSIRQGLDPRNFVLVALGGAGPVHAAALAQELKIKTVVIPRYPGVLAAAGLLAAPVEHEVSAAFAARLEQVELESVRLALKEINSRCAALMGQEGARSEDVQIQYFADLWYVGQSYYLEVALDLDGPEPLRRLYRDFLALHDRIYGYSTEAPVAFVNLRVVHRVGGREVLDETTYVAKSGEPSKPPRRITLAGGPATAAVYEREALPPGFLIEGPAIIEQLDSTTVVEQGWRGRVSENGNFILHHMGSTGESNA